MKKRIVSMLLCAAMCMTAVPSAYAMEVDSFTETAAEAMFKSFAKALDMAVSFDPRITDVLSTKGSL